MWIKATEYALLKARIAELEGQVQLWGDRHTKALAAADEWKARADAERLRSDEAVDQLLQTKGLPSVAPTEKPPTLEQLSDLFAEDPAEVREIVNEIKERGAESVLLESE